MLFTILMFFLSCLFCLCIFVDHEMVNFTTACSSAFCFRLASMQYWDTYQSKGARYVICEHVMMLAVTVIAMTDEALGGVVAGNIFM